MSASKQILIPNYSFFLKNAKLGSLILHKFAFSKIEEIYLIVKILKVNNSTKKLYHFFVLKSPHPFRKGKILKSDFSIPGKFGRHEFYFLGIK